MSRAYRFAGWFLTVVLGGCVAEDPRSPDSKLPPSLRTPAPLPLMEGDFNAPPVPLPPLALSNPTAFESLPGLQDWENEGFPSELSLWDDSPVVQDSLWVSFNSGPVVGSANSIHLNPAPVPASAARFSMKALPGLLVHKVGPASIALTKHMIVQGGRHLLYGGAKVLLITAAAVLKHHH